MQIGRVIGRVVPCAVVDGLEGVPMLWLQPLNEAGSPAGRPLVAADSTRMAAVGELVTFEGGREAALALEPWFVPVDHAIIGLVDAVHLAGDGAAR